MKKQPIHILIMITCIFSAFLLGLFLGRNQAGPEIEISQLPATPSHTAQPTQPTLPEETEPAVSFPLNINMASETELQQLPGIGPELSRRIIAFREINGNFSVPEDLLNVDGIGPGKLEAILDLITTGGTAQ